MPRYRLAVPLSLTVLRSGIPNRISGRTLEIGEGGLGVLPTSQLLVGESVRVEFLVPHTNMPVRATAIVRYQHEHSFGLQFLRLPIEQQSLVRYWTRSQGELLLNAAAGTLPEKIPSYLDSSGTSKARIKLPRYTAIFAAAVFVLAMALWWWHWQHQWTQLESQTVEAADSLIQVPADMMEQRVIYRILPEYPEQARQEGVQGTVVLDANVSKEGNVTRVAFVSGPAELSQAAADAVRWWRYEPYLVNHQPANVETTVSVNFRLTN